jgi:dTDP-4-dehydrorhamnose reductase
MSSDNGSPGSRPILLTGRTGQVGSELMRTLAPLGEVIAPGREQMDLSDTGSVREVIQSIQPRWIVNPAAYTAVDKAESEPELAYAINAEAVRVMGEEARKIGATVIHFSTDYVFDGTAVTPYREIDITNPVSVYGASKLAGEKALAESGVAHMIFRTSWVYGSRGKNFLLTILKLAREREKLRVVSDQHGSPTWSRDLAEMTAHVIRLCEEMPIENDDVALQKLNGIYHACGSGETTWYEFAHEAVRQAKARETELPFAEIEAITTAEYPTPAKRPANSRMCCQRLSERFGWTMMNWEQSLRQVLAEL